MNACHCYAFRARDKDNVAPGVRATRLDSSERRELNFSSPRPPSGLMIWRSPCGDGILAEFGSVVTAVECTVALQKAMTTRKAGLENGRGAAR